MTKKNKPTAFIYGASGHAKVVIDIIEKQGDYQIGFLIDDDEKLWGSEFFGYPVIGGKESLLNQQNNISAGIVAIGSNNARMDVAGWLAQNGFSFIKAIHPVAQLSRQVTVGAGTVVMAGAVINADTEIGEHVIVNTGATIDHDCSVADGSHIAPGATLCGTVKVGFGSFICAGATITPNLVLGRGVTVGAGATVLADIDDELTVVGSPATAI